MKRIHESAADQQAAFPVSESNHCQFYSNFEV